MPRKRPLPTIESVARWMLNKPAANGVEVDVDEIDGRRPAEVAKAKITLATVPWLSRRLRFWDDDRWFKAECESAKR
jgi:hypothetical protein